MTPDRKSQIGNPQPGHSHAGQLPVGQGERPAPRVTESVVAFRQPASRRFRRDDEENGATRGEILLFTGVRYERMPEPAAPSPRQRRPA